MYYGVSYHMFAFLFERTLLVIHCKTRLWSVLPTLIGSWTARSLWSQNITFSQVHLLFYPFSYVLFLMCFSTAVALVPTICLPNNSSFFFLKNLFNCFSYVTVLFIHKCFVFYFQCYNCLPTFIDPFCLELSRAFSLTFQLAVMHSVIIMMLQLLSLICEFGQFEKFLLFRLLSQKSFLPQFSFTHILFGLLQCMYLLLFISSMCSFPSLGWETIEMLIVPWF